MPYHDHDDDIFSEDGEDLHPRRQTILRVLCCEGNWKCFMLTIMIIGCMASVIWCNTTEMQREMIDLNSFPIKRIIRESPCDLGYAYIPIAFVVLLYLVFLVECYHCSTRIQLTNKVDITAITRRITSMTSAMPRVWWKAICYHYVRRKRQVTRYRNGDSYLANQVYYERVNTHTATTSFSYICCGQSDASRTMILDAQTPVTKVRFSKGFAFANIESASEFEDQRSRFFAEHERFDDFMEMREGLDLTGVSSFKEYMVAYRDVEQWSWYSSQLFFWCMSCLLLSWPLRILIEYNTAYVHYTITKIFGTNYELDPNRQTDLETHLSDTLPPVPASNYAWAQLIDEQSAIICSTPRPHRNLPLSHASTVDSLELFAAIRENCAIVPSYSEAVRIDAALQEDPEENATEETATTTVASIDEPRPRPNTLFGAHSTSNIATSSNADIGSTQQNRRSWAGVLINPGINARQLLEEIRTEQPISYQYIDAQPGCSTTRDSTYTLFYPKDLSPTCSRDPFGGRQQTTPTDEPPTYEEALRLPTMRTLTTSISGTQLAGTRNAFLRDVVNNRRSCLEGVGLLSNAHVLRIPSDEPGEETAL